MRLMKHIALSATRSAALTVLALSALMGAGCATTSNVDDDGSEPTLVDAPAPPAEETAPIPEGAANPGEGSKEEEGEVPIPVAESEHPAEPPKETPKEV